MGLITLSILCIQTIGGSVAKFSASLRNFLPARPNDIKRIHRYSGILSILAICITVSLAMFSLWFQAVLGAEGFWFILWWPMILSVTIPLLAAIKNTNF